MDGVDHVTSGLFIKLSARQLQPSRRYISAKVTGRHTKQFNGATQIVLDIRSVPKVSSVRFAACCELVRSLYIYATEW